jgi:galactose mutarotase-like enzyme
LSVILQNGAFAAKISETGAELKSLARLGTGTEYIWPGDPAWWTGSAPILFPVVGGLRNGSYTHGGRLYRLGNHGFARTSLFTLASETGDAAELRLSASPETLACYPFDFTLTVGFRLRPDGIAVRYTVANNGRERMLFSIGSHAAFNVPMTGGALEDYSVVFDQEESCPRWFLDRGNCLIAGATEEIIKDGRTIPLSRTLFDRGALVFKAPRSRRFSLRNGLDSRSLTVVTEGTPYLGIWAKPGSPPGGHAASTNVPGRVPPFVCIEPWHGIPDSTEASGILAEKEGIMSLEPGSLFETGYTIEVE